jgi:excisionase family DNA binding protein
MPKYYTPEEVAQELRVTRRTLYEWLKTGRLRGVQVGRGWRIRPEDVELFVQGGASAAPTRPPKIDPEERAARVRAARGSMAHLPISVDEYIREKREELAREDADGKPQGR